MVGGNISSEKIDLLVYGPNKPIVDNGFSDQFVLHPFETRADLDRLNPAVAAKIRGAAVTYSTVRCDGKMMALLPKLESSLPSASATTTSTPITRASITLS